MKFLSWKPYIMVVTHHLGLHHHRLEQRALHGQIRQQIGRLRATQISLLDNRHSLSAHS